MKRTVIWIVAALLAVEFILAGASKLGSASGWVPMFARWGYPDWARYTVGIIEICAGATLLVPRGRRPASGLLLVIMAGATVTQLIHEPSRAILPLALGAVVAWLMRSA